jgi:hypothetical protein
MGCASSIEEDVDRVEKCPVSRLSVRWQVCRYRESECSVASESTTTGEYVCKYSVRGASCVVKSVDLGGGGRSRG